MGLVRRTTYGRGGYDPAKPNNNVVDEADLPTPPELDNEQTLQGAALAALDNLRAYRDAASPTNAQTVAVVKLLCRVVIALVRLQLHQLDASD